MSRSVFALWSFRKNQTQRAPLARRRSVERLEERAMLTVSPQPISPGDAVAGNIAVNGQTQDYTLTASANDWFDVNVADTPGSGLRPEVTIYGPSGTQVAQGSAGLGNSASVYYAVPSGGGGTYSVVVGDDGFLGNRTGGFTVELTGDLLLALAELSDNVYSGTTGADGFTAIGPLSTDPLNPGYTAAAYLSPDRSQVIIAFRGTVTTGAAGVEDLAADASFLTSQSNLALAGMTSDAAHFVALIHSEFKSATITLTGHSLGGALAQLVGQEAHLSVESFNAPGAAAVFGQLGAALAPAGDLGSSNLSVAYRLYADQVSLAGQQFADTQTITVADPPGTTFDRLPNNPLLDLAVNASTYDHLHAITTVVGQIMANAPLMPSNAQEPNDILPIEEAIQELGLALAEAGNNSLVAKSVDSIFEL